MKKETNTTALGDLVDLVMGQAPPSKDTNFEGRGTPFVKVGEFGAIRPVIREWTTNPLRMARPTDVLLCVVGATCGKINLGEDCAIGRSVAAIRPHPTKLDQFYLHYFMMTLVERLRSGSVGAAQTVISKEMVETVQIPVPPLAEQQRIVGLLDEAFEGLATAKANAEKNLQNARALFESHLQAVFTQRGPGWVERPLGDCVNSISTGPFGSLLHKSDYEQSGIPLVNPINIEGDQIIPDDRKTIGRATAIRLASYVLRENDIVIGRRGEIGRCAVISSDQAGWLCGTGCFFIRPSDKTDPHYLTHLLRSYPYRSILEGASARATMPSISNDDLARLVVWLPPMAQQRRTLKLLESLSTKTQRLARLYEQKLALLTALKKSLLHQAFTGEL